MGDRPDRDEEGGGREPSEEEAPPGPVRADKGDAERDRDRGVDRDVGDPLPPDVVDGDSDQEPRVLGGDPGHPGWPIRQTLIHG